MFERYTEPARKAVFFARFEASQFGSPEIETEHLLLGILRESKELAQRLLLSPTKIEAIREQIRKHHPVREKVSTSVDLPLSHPCRRALAYAEEEAERMNHKHIRPEHLLLGLSREDSGLVPDILRENSITTSELRTDAILSALQLGASKPEPPPPASASGRDLTQAAVAGRLGPLVGRERELERLIHILSRRTKNNCVLIGDAGVGKTAIVEGLALRMADVQVPPTLTERRLIAVDASSLVAPGLAGIADSATILFVRGLFNLAVSGSAWPVVEAMHVLERLREQHDPNQPLTSIVTPEDIDAAVAARAGVAARGCSGPVAGERRGRTAPYHGRAVRRASRRHPCVGPFPGCLPG